MSRGNRSNVEFRAKSRVSPGEINDKTSMEPQPRFLKGKVEGKEGLRRI